MQMAQWMGLCSSVVNRSPDLCDGVMLLCVCLSVNIVPQHAQRVITNQLHFWLGPSL